MYHMQKSNLSSRCRVIFQAIFLMGLVIPVVIAQPAVSGEVKARDDLGLSRAPIVLQDLNDQAVVFRTTTDRQGRYAFVEVPDGSYSLEVSYNGFVGVRLSPIRVQFPFRVKENFVLEVALGNGDAVYVYTQVVGELKQAGRRLSHAKLCLEGPGGGCTETNGIGQYSLVVLPGSYDVLVSANGNNLWKGHIDLPRVGPYRDKIQPDGQSQK